MRVSVGVGRALTVAAAALVCSGCGAVNTVPGRLIGNSQVAQTAATPLNRADSKIKHIVIVIQENRSFNNLFYGVPGAKTSAYGYDSKNQKIELKPIGLETTWDLPHNSDGFYAACNGSGNIPGTHCRMNGFDKEGCGAGPHCPKDHPEYAFVPHNETKPYFDMAKQYVLADEMFASNFDASSFVSHQYIIAAQANATTNYPYSWWGCEGSKGDKIWTIGGHRQYVDQIEPCYNITTLADELDHKSLSWAFYASSIGKEPNYGIWSSYQSIDHIYNGPDWHKDVISPPSQFLTDIAGGKLAAVTWITPTYADSDHAGAGSNTGPSWVASVVNGIGESTFWNSTAIFVFWDDYGGWYDPVAPAFVDYDGLGLRLPLLVISPYARRGKVSHVHYEHGSILKFY